MDSEKDDSEYQSRHYIAIKELGVEISNVIIYKTNSASSIHEDTFVVEDNKLWIVSVNKIYCLEIPSLILVWKKEFDHITNFALYKLKDDFIIYGELEIFRITKMEKLSGVLEEEIFG